MTARDEGVLIVNTIRIFICRLQRFDRFTTAKFNSF